MNVENIALAMRSTIPKSGIYNMKLIKLVVKKATIRTLFPPKPKHTSVLIRLSCQEYTPLRDLMVPLESRLNETNWVVVYKALLVFYLLFRDGDSRKIFEYVKKPFLEHLYLFRDVKRSLGPYQSPYIQYFARYLDLKLAVYERLGFEEYTKSIGDAQIKRLRETAVGEALFNQASELIAIIDFIMKTPIVPGQITTELTLSCFVCLLKDLLKYYHALNEIIINILDSYFKMNDRASVERSLEIYKKMTGLTEVVIEFLKAAKRIQHYLGFQVPILVMAPKSLEKTLQDHFDAFVEGINYRDAASMDTDTFQQAKNQMEEQNLLLIDFEDNPNPVVAAVDDTDSAACSQQQILSELDLFRNTVQDSVSEGKALGLIDGPRFRGKHVAEFVDLDNPTEEIMADFERPQFCKINDRTFVIFPIVPPTAASASSPGPPPNSLASPPLLTLEGHHHQPQGHHQGLTSNNLYLQPAEISAISHPSLLSLSPDPSLISSPPARHLPSPSSPPSSSVSSAAQAHQEDHLAKTTSALDDLWLEFKPPSHR